jgi:enoyl-CoA hydratase
MAVNFTVEEGIAVITIARPEARNAIDRETALGIAEAIVRIESEEAIRVAVLTGAGGTFCAGMDLKAFLRGEVIRLPGTGLAGMTQAKKRKPLWRGA